MRARKYGKGFENGLNDIVSEMNHNLPGRGGGESLK